MQNILECFEQTADRLPQKIALRGQQDAYTFGELRHAARCMAQTIRTKSEIKSEPIGVFVNRGIDTVLFFLAVLYSGNYYMPVDPDMPAAKIQMELDGSGTRVILGGHENDELIRQLAYDGIWLTKEDICETEADLPVVSESDPIYLVYTSGSTGRPKGVLKSYGAVKSFIEAYADTFALTDEEIIGNQTPLFFDASAKDVYLMMYTGATLEVIPSELFIFPIRLIEYMNERKITYICWVPTALSLVIQMKAFRKILPETLKKVFFVGEVFPIKQLNEWLKTLPDLKYVNLYGSTEIAGICCYYELDTARTYEFLPMGKALSNCEVFLLDDGQIITQPGRNGEVCVASPALALEYYKDEAKTAEVFVTLDLEDKKNMRVLKTGDFARYDESGDLVFVTRKDFQIKHMGRRIELGEIEAVADSITEIARCCCLYDDKKKRIHLFCQMMPDCTWDKKDVLHELRGKLSDYMLPGKVTILEEMPFNANGKIDRTGLKELL